MFGRRIGFVKFTAGIRWAEDGKPLPGIVFCRGGAVAVLLIVRPSDAAAAVADQGGNDDDSWVVLTVQPRLPVALLEDPALPAGMLDGDSNFAGVAAKELEEECGIRMTAEDLVDLTSFRTLDEGDDEGAGVDETGLFPSAGGCDEFIRLFLCEKRLPLAQIRELEGREAGLRDEGERIRVKLVRLRDLWRSTRDMKALAALALYGIRRGGAA
nr:hypothetical protein HK105_003757 [Polyrhizophydium stewartii]